MTLSFRSGSDELPALDQETHGLEREAWTHLVRSAARPAVAAADISAIQVGSALALRSRTGGPLMNRAFGVPARERDLRGVVAHYQAANVPLYFIQIDDPDRARRDRLAGEVGLVRYRRAMLHLVRRAGPVREVSTVFDIGVAGAGEVLRAANIFCTAFDIAPSLAPMFASLHDTSRWRILVARCEHEPVAVGLLYVDGDRGYLMGGATAPRFRGMGAQAALIAARLRVAEELGCRVVGSETGEPVVGDPQFSFRNMLRAGFQVVGRIDSYAPPGIVWTHGRRTVQAP